ncbi:hypothetical protein [Streptomyces sp. NRRL S-1521]|uniref:hypothetical protein n=1 Tax=Streptomyces sp. NRRL S-1521 TaxID=1609100 RepID=UPI000A5F4141|nr:hypothetical protein [Streptomyces sp. NRRL S-1521]
MIEPPTTNSGARSNSFCSTDCRFTNRRIGLTPVARLRPASDRAMDLRFAAVSARPEAD